jgi:hypothetical protein
VAAKDDRLQVGVAGVIDEFRAAASRDAVDVPIRVELEQIDVLALGAALGLAPADALSGVLDDLAPRRDRLFGEDAPAVDARRLDQQAVAAELRIDRRNG